MELLHFSLTLYKLNTCKGNDMSVELLIDCQFIIKLIREITVNMDECRCYHVRRKYHPSIFCTCELHTEKI